MLFIQAIWIKYQVVDNKSINIRNLSCKRFNAIFFCFFTVSTFKSNSLAISEGFFPSNVSKQIFLHCGGSCSTEESN